MMGVYIKGMEMPTSCDDCRFAVDGWCYACVPESAEERRRITTNYCPLIEIPPHGDLIDRDALIKEINERIEAAIQWGVNAIADRDTEIKLRAKLAVATFCKASLTAKKLPTIIPADEPFGKSEQLNL